MRNIDPKVEEAIDTLDIKGVARRRLLSGAGLVSATAAASALLAACSSENRQQSDAAEGGPGNYPGTPRWRFVFVNHVTTNSFFTPTQYGAQDACALLNCTFQWTGSQNSVTAEMVNALSQAVSGRADGIAVAVTDRTAFRQPVDRALDQGIPVVSYNADGARGDTGSNRLAYIGQDLYNSGFQLGTRIAQLMPNGGDAVGFIATPGSLNIQPRIDGARDAIRQSGKNINFEDVATGAELPRELSVIDAYSQGHPNLRGMFAVDAGSTENTGKVVAKYNLKQRGVVAGGFDLNPSTLQSIRAGHLDFTIDQQPYLQGFLPVLQLYMYKLSGGLVAPSDTNTGLLFVTRENVGPYLTSRTRYEGSTTQQRYLPRTGAIPHE
jgi:simple sugar transport system substrate-binding protein